MKNLFIIALAFVTLQATAQQKRDGERRELRKERPNIAPEEAAEMQTKKLTLHLDLNQEQQEKVNALMLEEAKVRKAKMEERKAEREKAREKMEEMREETKEERLKMANERLDRQIELKAKMKDILTEEQYAKWEETMEKRKGEGRKNRGKREGKR